MATNKMQIAALAVFRGLYDSKKDVFSIICEFIKTSIVSRNIYSVNTTQVAELLKNDYGFKIPEAVISTVLGKIAQRNRGEYIIDDMAKLKDSTVTDQYESIQTSNNAIIENLIEYVEQKEGNKLSDLEKATLSQSFCAFLLDDSSNVDYSEYISAFIVNGKSDDQFTHRLNTIKEGVVLYSGLQYNSNLNEVGTWTSPLIIYVEPEILFHFAGYNGELYQNLFDDFYNLVREINIKSKQKKGIQLIKIKYFPEVKTDMDHFFSTAENIVEKGLMHDSSKTAMVSIVSGCSSGADVIQKKADFETLLQTHSISQEEEFNFYNVTSNNEYNIENDELLSELSKDIPEEDIYPHLKYLYYINVLRRGEEFQRLEDAHYILLTGNRKTIYMANHPFIKANGVVPLATDLNFITSKLWFKLNKGFGTGNYPKSFDIVNKAQMVLAAHINNSIAEEYGKIKQNIDSGILTLESATAALAELKSRVRKPEDIITENVDSVLNAISDNDIEKYLREREIERIRAKEQEALNRELEQSLTELKEEKYQTENLYKQSLTDKDQSHIYELQEQKKSHLAELKLQKEKELKVTISFIDDIVRRKLKADKRIKLRLLTYKLVPAGLFFLYLIIMGIGTYIYTWDIMEPITYFGSGLWALFIYAFCAYKGASFNPIVYFTKIWQPIIIAKFYKEYDVDLDKLEMLSQQERDLETFINQ